MTQEHPNLSKAIVFAGGDEFRIVSRKLFAKLGVVKGTAFASFRLSLRTSRPKRRDRGSVVGAFNIL